MNSHCELRTLLIALLWTLAPLATSGGCADPAPITAEVSLDGTSSDTSDGASSDTVDTSDNGAEVVSDAGPDGADVDVDSGPDFVTGPPRVAGARTPRTADCDDADPGHCLLPFPSNVFTTADDERETGLRLFLQGATFPNDPLWRLNRADGFSSINPIVTSFAAPLDETSLSIVLIVAEGPRTGEVAATFCEYTQEDLAPLTSAMICYPHRPLDANTEHLVVVPNTVTYADGSSVESDDVARISLGIQAPTNQEEADRWAYHGPARLALEAANVSVDTVARMWDFTTRSAEDPRQDLRFLREAAIAALATPAVEIVIDNVEIPPAESTNALFVEGHLTGIPGFLAPTGMPTRDPVTGLPDLTITTNAPFRAVVPKGEGDYRIVLFGHGTGGNVRDNSFDELITGAGGMKLGLEFAGWTDTDFGATVNDLLDPIRGTARNEARTTQSLAGSSAILESAMRGALGDLLSAETIDGVVNPTAGRRPLEGDVIWAGGSLGGVMGLIFSNLEPEILGGVLNVPGAGFSRWLLQSDLFYLLEIGLMNRYDSRVGLNLIVAMSQVLFDGMDGAAWASASPTKPVFLVQISVDDPVVPNVGSNLVATSVDAVHVGVPLYEVVGLDKGDTAVGRSGLTQYNVAYEGADINAVHGFTARDNIAGAAAQKQFIDFAISLWAGAPLITVPQGCLDLGPLVGCDFREALQ